jgi:hypothetical protein
MLLALVSPSISLFRRSRALARAFDPTLPRREGERAGVISHGGAKKEVAVVVVMALIRRC